MTDLKERTSSTLSPEPIPRFAAHQQQIIFSSPLPPPEILSKYEQIQPGLINEILQLTKTQNEHRRDSETKNLDAQIAHQQNIKDLTE